MIDLTSIALQIAIRVHQDGLLLQRLYFAGEVYNAAEIDRGAEPKIRDQERTLAERLISELSATEFHPENYEDEYRKRVLKAIEQKVAGQEIERVEVEAAVMMMVHLVSSRDHQLGLLPSASAPFNRLGHDGPGGGATSSASRPRRAAIGPRRPRSAAASRRRRTRSPPRCRPR